ncbi:MAG: DNA/RNA nuclease SfsA [Candidatus Lokiarchaeota archaeon]|nr:DNA/RNA nuclease SfsA [Candidatus Lokiarchaeota archaeon]
MISNHIILFKINNLQKGIFLNRQNRFVGEIKFRDKIELAHIHDPGRLKELLIKGAQILFTTSNGKLKYYIKAIKKNNEWILIDSALHSKIALKVIKLLPEFSNVRQIKKEVQIGKSRIDFLLDDIPLEVKGASLVKNKIALFPDAPTKRGKRHVEEIIRHNGILLFLIFRKAEKFCPNQETDPEFASKLSEARSKGIKIIPIQINFDGETIYYIGKIELADF